MSSTAIDDNEEAPGDATPVEAEKIEDTDGEIKHESGEDVEQNAQVEIEQAEGEQPGGDIIEDEEKVEEKEKVEGEDIVEGEETVQGEESVGLEEKTEGEEKAHGEEEDTGETGEGKVEGEHFDGEELLGEHEENLEEEKIDEDEKKVEVAEEQVEEEEDQYVEEPVDPAAPLNLTDSKEALQPDFELRPEQLAEVERLWELYQDYTPAYADIKGFITIKELVYMLKALLIMTYTEDQLMELINFVCRPPNEKGLITYEQFLRMVIIRQRDYDIEEELRAALQVLDPQKSGEVEREELQEVLAKLGNKLPQKILDNFLKEIDISGEGKIGIEDVVAICGMDLRKDDILMKSEPEDEGEAGETV